MRLPRDVDGDELARKLSIFSYVIVRQSGSHIRLTTEMNGQHHVTVPLHKPVRMGTLAGIIDDVAKHLDLTRDEVIRRLFK
jgi:predicted RNA binding protein YcfA (HicA-like mRNA interferase family)